MHHGSSVPNPAVGQERRAAFRVPCRPEPQAAVAPRDIDPLTATVGGGTAALQADIEQLSGAVSDAASSSPKRPSWRR